MRKRITIITILGALALLGLGVFFYQAEKENREMQEFWEQPLTPTSEMFRDVQGQ